MPAQLLALNEGSSILLDKPILLLGRDLECDIRLDSRKISRRHCCIAQIGEQFIIRDLGSTNGIRINGVRVVEGRLAAGDELTIGNYHYRVQWEAPAAKPGAPALPRKDKKKAPVALDRPPGDDDALEAADEPVPLSEPGGRAVPAPLAQAPADSAPTPAARPLYQPIVPENLELAAPSDVQEPPPAPAAPSGNHHYPAPPTVQDNGESLPRPSA
jgi:predicted component of type VI protein secretion system